MDFMKVSSSSRRPLCLERRYGRAGNMMVTLAKGLHMARKLNTTLALFRSLWDGEILDMMEPHPEIQIWNISKLDIPKLAKSFCHKVLRGKGAFFNYYYDYNRSFGEARLNPLKQRFIPELREILPSQKIRERAGELMCNQLNLECKKDVAETMALEYGANQYSKLPFVSVHRRKLDERDTKMYFRRKETCSINITRMAVDVDYNYILDNYFNKNTDQEPISDLEGNHSSSHSFQTHCPIVLFTDGIVAEKDATFPFRAPKDSSIVEEMWMMTISERHFGNPGSTIDFVIFHWRTLMPWWQRGNATTNYNATNNSGVTHNFKPLPINDWETTEGNQGVGMVPEECF